MSARIAGSRARCRQASAYEGGTAPTIARMSRSVASRRDLPYDVARDDPACIAYRTGGGVFRRPRSARRSRLTWFALSLAAALTQAAQFAVVKGRARAIPPLVIVAGTQTVALTVWLGFFLVSGHPFTPPRSAWPAIAASSILVTGMSSLLARASACGDISIVGPVFALSPIFTVIPDAVLSGTLPSPLGWFGIVLAVAGTLSLSGRPDRGRLCALLGRRDALDALAAAILLGVLSAVDRWAAVVLGPPSYLACSHGAAAVLTGVISAVTVRRGLVELATARNVATIVAHGVLEHHRGRPDLADRVRDALAVDVGRRAVDGLEQRGKHALRVDVGGWRDADGAGAGGAEIRQDVAEQVGRYDDVEPVRMRDEVRGQDIDVELVPADVGILLGHCLDALVPVRHRDRDAVRLGR